MGDYIQWLFPTDQKSEFNENAPVLTDSDQDIFKNDTSLQNELRKNFNLFAKFLGFTYGSDGKLMPSEQFDDRREDCWRRNNHNWRRITRVLRCLRLCGLDCEKNDLMQALEDLHNRRDADGVDCSGVIENYWRREMSAENIVGTPNQKPKPRERKNGKQKTNRTRGIKNETNGQDEKVDSSDEKGTSNTKMFFINMVTLVLLVIWW